MAPKKTNKKNEVPTTGHEWDGIQEYDNPLPRWWLWVFILCIIFAIGYAIYYPAIPFVNNNFSEGAGGWSQYKQLEDSKNRAAEEKKEFNDRIANMTVQEIGEDPDLANFAIAAGKAQFALSCSQCHGLGAQGAKGYPSLLDDEWIWGGELNDIIYTITNGIRSYDNENTRDNVMMAYGKEEALSVKEIADVTRYIKVISDNFLTNDASDRGEVIFADNCASCHGEKGEGDQTQGAPALNNAIWLYGGHTDDIKETLMNGRAGMMPAFGSQLSEDDIKKLALYVYSLGSAEGR